MIVVVEVVELVEGPARCARAVAEERTGHEVAPALVLVQEGQAGQLDAQDEDERAVVGAREVTSEAEAGQTAGATEPEERGSPSSGRQAEVVDHVALERRRRDHEGRLEGQRLGHRL